MTHSPIVPPGNQAPFPRQAPPAPKELPPLMRGVANRRRPDAGLVLGIGAAVALLAGSVAMFWRRRPS